MYNIGIIGKGFVGSAIKGFLSQNSGVSIRSYDVKDDIDINIGYEKVVNSSSIIYVCVPTPPDKDGNCDTGIVDGVCNLLNYYAGKVSKRPIVLIKSTMSVGSTEKLQEKYENCIIVCNPEFLTERTALKDVSETSRHLLGIPKNSIVNKNSLVFFYLIKFLEDCWPKSRCVKTDSATAEMIKTTTNSFFAVKVSFANILHDLCQSLGVDYQKMIKTMTEIDDRVGDLHWQVPGHDGKRGFGGKCLPKELSSMYSMCNESEINSKLLESVIQYNDLIREKE